MILRPMGNSLYPKTNLIFFSKKSFHGPSDHESSAPAFLFTKDYCALILIPPSLRLRMDMARAEFCDVCTSLTWNMEEFVAFWKVRVHIQQPFSAPEVQAPEWLL